MRRLDTMSVEEIQTELRGLSPERRAEVIASAVHLNNQSDSAAAQKIRERMDDQDEGNWLTIEEFEARLDQS